jgi:glycerol-3-phosphate acyltransferase PlsY
VFPYILGPIICYLLGAVPFGFLIAKAKGVDIRKQGSGNIGATNVGRVLGRQWFFIVFALDFLKGLASVALVFPLLNPADALVNLQVVYGMAAFIGHTFPVYLGFKGGKGIATGSGVFAYLTPFPFLAGLVVWVALYASLRYVSLASICGVIVFTASYFLLPHDFDEFAPNVLLLTLACALVALIIIFKHRQNISRLLSGKEVRT